jgi:hypothetical protein
MIKSFGGGSEVESLKEFSLPLFYVVVTNIPNVLHDNPTFDIPTLLRYRLSIHFHILSICNFLLTFVNCCVQVIYDEIKRKLFTNFFDFQKFFFLIFHLKLQVLLLFFTRFKISRKKERIYRPGMM